MPSPSESTSLYRRHRPGSFDEVVGQRHVVRTLRNAVEKDKVHHAYLFVGSRGTGKTSMAKILARSLNCERGGPTVTPCGECESCLTIAAGTSVDVIEMDAASNRSVDDVRDLRERVAYAPAAGRWKVYILDEAHMLTKEAWNAFLKTLEEPPPNTVFVLATTEAHKVMATIADRCQRFDFQRPSLEQISEVVNRVADAEGIEVEEGAVAMIARSASGSFRDALGTLDQLVAFGGEKVSLESVLEVLGAVDADLLFEAVDAVIAEDPKGALLGVEKMARSGRDPSQFARDLLAHLRHLLVTQTVGEVPNTFVVTATDSDRLAAQANAISAATLVRTIDELAAALTAVREGDDARMAVEIALLKAARPDLDPSTEGLLRTSGKARTRDGMLLFPRLTRRASPAGGARRGAHPCRHKLSYPSRRGVPSATGAAGGPPRGSFSYRRGWGVPCGDRTRRRDRSRPGCGSSDLACCPRQAAVRRARLWRRRSMVLVRLALDDDGLTIGFPAEFTFNKRKAEAPDKRDLIADAFEAVAGERLRPTYVLLEGEDAPPQEAPSEEIDHDALVERLKSEFDAEEVG